MCDMAYPQASLLVGLSTRICKPVLMHDPVSLDSLGRFSSVENQSLLYPNMFAAILWSDRLVSSSCFPITTPSSPVRPGTIRVFPVTWREEIPFFLSKQCLVCSTKRHPHQQKAIKQRNPDLKISKLQQKQSFHQIIFNPFKRNTNIYSSITAYDHTSPIPGSCHGSYL